MPSITLPFYASYIYSTFTCKCFSTNLKGVKRSEKVILRISCTTHDTKKKTNFSKMKSHSNITYILPDSNGYFKWNQSIIEYRSEEKYCK